MKWKQIDCMVTFGLFGAVFGCVFHYIYGTIIGVLFGLWVATRCEEYRSAKCKGAMNGNGDKADI
jgi:ABC-type phosphate transport system permease subunit